MEIYRFKQLGYQLPPGSGLIKASHSAELAAANDVMTSAEVHASQVVYEAELHFDNERKRGFAEGKEAANAAALERLLHEHVALDNHLNNIEMGLARLVLASVRKIVHSFDDIDLAMALIHGGLTNVRREARVQIRVPEALREELKARIDDLLSVFPQIEFFDMVEDPTLSAPNIIIETAIGRIDCDLNAKLDQLDTAIDQVVADRSADADFVIGAGHD